MDQPGTGVEATALSSGVAVAVRSNVGVKPGSPELSGAGAHRIALTHISGIFPSGLLFASVYMVTALGPKAANLALLERLGQILCQQGAPWIVGMDANMSVDELLQTDWRRKVGGVLCAPSEHTCHQGAGRTIDYFVVAESLAGAVQKPKV